MKFLIHWRKVWKIPSEGQHQSRCGVEVWVVVHTNQRNPFLHLWMSVCSSVFDSIYFDGHFLSFSVVLLPTFFSTAGRSYTALCFFLWTAIPNVHNSMHIQSSRCIGLPKHGCNACCNSQACITSVNGRERTGDQFPCHIPLIFPLLWIHLSEPMRCWDVHLSYKQNSHYRLQGMEDKWRDDRKMGEIFPAEDWS